MISARKNGFFEKIALPAIGAALVAGAAMAATGDLTEPAYGGAIKELSRGVNDRRAEILFAQADLDGSGDLSATEFAALSLVSAELARLNGFVAVDLGDAAPGVIDIADEAPASVSGADRTRIEAVATHEFHSAAGEDGVLTPSDFVAFERRKFDDADRDADGALRRQELGAYGLKVARAPLKAA